ncbi:MAG: DUF4446 family protein [Fimbriimonadales bacterium]|nr:DUF4446 family protein [Fimbriimonadales bacterium]
MIAIFRMGWDRPGPFEAGRRFRYTEERLFPAAAMDSLLRTFSENTGPWLLTALALIIIVACAVAGLWLKLRRLYRRWRTLLDEASGANLERLLEHHLVEKVRLDDRVRALEDLGGRLESALRRSNRRAALVRFDAFEDVGGQQSFALAMLDDLGNGIVLTSLIGRNDCRVYCKPIEDWKSPKNLSPEEREALRLAQEAP